MAKEQTQSQIQMGSVGPDVSKLQQNMKSLGFYTGRTDGVWGPKTQKAIKEYQDFIGVPQTGWLDQNAQNSLSTLQSHPMGHVLSDPLIQDAMSKDKRLYDTLLGLGNENGTRAAMVGASKKMNENLLSSTGFGNNQDLYLTGDLNTDANWWKKAQEVAKSELQPGYDEALRLYSGDYNSKIQKERADYESALATSQQQLGTDKETLDTNAAKNGTLFSTQRVQKQNNLANTYNRDLQDKQRNLEYGIGSTARQFEADYGTNNLSNLNTNIPQAGNVDGGVLKYTAGAMKNAYTPTGNVGGSKPRQFLLDTAKRTDQLKNSYYYGRN